MNLVKYDASCKAIAEAKSVDEIKMIHNTAQAIAAAARVAKNHSLEIDAAEIRIRAERRLGEMNGEAVKDAPPEKKDSPRGLFGNEITALAARVSHFHEGWWRSGMVYWSDTFPYSSPALRLIAPYEEVVDDWT